MRADWKDVREAIKIVMEGVNPLPSESCSLDRALGRVLAADVVSPIHLPAWTNSAMDGFAVHSADIRGASQEVPVQIPVVDDVVAGGFPKGPLIRGTAARVMTGAPVPDGADSVVRVEHTDGGHRQSETGTPSVVIFSDQDAGRNLRRKGEEISPGGVALRRGDRLNAGGLGVAASLGYARLDVYRRPVVAVLTSGDELVHVEDFSEVAAGRKIVSSNSYTLRAALEDAGCTVKYLGIAKDSRESLRSAFESAAGCDALVTSAGISVGDHDHTKEVLTEIGARIAFWRVRMRPGSPFAFGWIDSLGGIPWFGLPGNPVSTAVTFELFVRSALRKMEGATRPFPLALEAVFDGEFKSPAGLTQFLRVTLDREGSDLVARLTGRQGSGVLSSVATADGLMIIPEDRPGAKPGERFRILPFEGPLSAEIGF